MGYCHRLFAQRRQNLFHLLRQIEVFLHGAFRFVVIFFCFFLCVRLFGFFPYIGLFFYCVRVRVRVFDFFRFVGSCVFLTSIVLFVVCVFLTSIFLTSIFLTSIFLTSIFLTSISSPASSSPASSSPASSSPAPQNTTQKSISIVFSVSAIRHDSSLSKYRKQKQSPPGNTKNGERPGG